MKHIIVASITLVSILASASTVSAAANREDFRGRWSRDCGNGMTCHLDIDDTKSQKTVEISFSIEGNGASCSWSVDSVYQKDWGGPVARDPYGNYYFYLTIHDDRRLYSSGTMLPNCGPQPLDQYFVSDPVLGAPANEVSTVSDEDAQAMIDNRSIFDHNGSAMNIDPSRGTIVYRDPKKSIAGTVKSGALLFKADAPWDPYDDKTIVKGTAYVFKKGCDPAPYEVSGRQQGWHTLVLKGVAPVRAKNSCKVIGHKMNGNSTLKFVSWGD
ncbi:hypothetical protein IB238_09745 [Rhizobium sp. ARZ01]|uniref:hypothetical protein n=1 Tax=Rhizobium sp. ARZ01 TaxID=2769313 RepID=UPI001783472D|nr:hypothetical protein [Rhizobium sp. ARZ01]MBD9372899.1 hypothetical protein [Rhizobium sp. ARZ01]